MNDPWMIASLTAILSIGIFVQAAAGFAAGLLIIPSMLWFGYQIPEAQTALLVATIPQNLWGVWSFRDAVAPRQVVWPGVGRVVGLPLGIAILYSMEAFPVVMLRQIVGGFVLVSTLSILWFRPEPRESLSPVWGWLAFPLSGFCQGLVGMGGPVMVFWVQAHDWGTRQSRAFLFSMYLISILPALAILGFAFGGRIVKTGLLTTLLIPILLIVTLMGLRFGTWLGRRRLRAVTLGLLFLIGLAGLAAPWLSR
ncbi:MAG: TSUP family transporter [Planctomycetota bacterium]